MAPKLPYTVMRKRDRRQGGRQRWRRRKKENRKKALSKERVCGLA